LGISGQRRLIRRRRGRHFPLHFAAAVSSGTACSPGIDDGVAALVLAEAAVESAGSGRTVAVDLGGFLPGGRTATATAAISDEGTV
jgi:predicted dehydrogenase